MMTNHSRLAKKRTTDGKIKKRISLKQANALDFHPLEPRHLLAAVAVTTANDLTNADTSSIAALMANDGGDGISLREAIVASNNTLGSDTITFDSSVFTGGGNSLIRLTQGELSIDESLLIDGSAGNDIVITADADGDDVTIPNTFITDVSASFDGTAGAAEDLLDDNSRVIRFAGLANDTLMLADLTITGGRTTGSFSDGGGIFSDSGDISLTNSTINGNSTSGRQSEGGGIYSEHGDISLTNSSLHGNSTIGHSADGGGIYSRFGSISLTNSNVSENSTSGYGAAGGGIYARNGTVSLPHSNVSGNSTSDANSPGGGIFSSGGGILLTKSTVSGNSTTGFESQGGGISATSSTPVTLINSTVLGNSTSGFAFSDGGGISSYRGTISLINSTVSGNSTFGGNSFGGGIRTFGSISLTNSTVTENLARNVGGGIILRDTGGNLTIQNSIVAGNSDDGTAPDVSIPADLVSNLNVEFSLIGDTAGSILDTSTGTGNILNQPALLGPLADNGGTTLTHELLPDSPAIDAGNDVLAVDSNGLALTTDQRGAGFDRIAGNSVDIGAFEVQDAGSTTPSIVSATINEGGVLARPDLWNTLSVVFDSDVTVESADLSLANDSLEGVAVDLTGIGFSYDSTTNTAIWDFTTLDPLGAAFYTWQLNAGSITNGHLSLDGNGDGSGGDNFVAQHYVAIPGDANRDGVVDVLNDAFALVGNLGSTTNLAWADGNFNGDGSVSVLGDAFTLVGNLGQDVRPPATASSAATARVPRPAAITVQTTDPFSDTDGRDSSSKNVNLAAVESAQPQLALAGDHDLRDDVFGSDF